MTSSFIVPAVGASGALYGVLVAFGMLFPNSQLMLLFPPIPVKAKYLISFLVIIDLIGGFTGGFSLFGRGFLHKILFHQKRNSS